MVELVVVIILLVGLVGFLALLLGFRLGSGHWQHDLLRVKAESLQASLAMYELTREALLAMLEEAEREWRR